MAKRWILTMEGPFVGTKEVRALIYDDHVTEEQISKDWLDEAVNHYEQWLDTEDFEDENYDEAESSSNYYVVPYDENEHEGTFH